MRPSWIWRARASSAARSRGGSVIGLHRSAVAVAVGPARTAGLGNVVEHADVARRWRREGRAGRGVADWGGVGRGSVVGPRHLEERLDIGEGERRASSTSPADADLVGAAVVGDAAVLQ